MSEVVPEPAQPGPSIHPMVEAAVRAYRIGAVVDVRVEGPSHHAACQSDEPPRYSHPPRLAEPGDRPVRSRDLCLWDGGLDGLVPRPTPRAPAPSVDVIHLADAEPGDIARYFPLLSPCGVLIVEGGAEADTLKCEAADYADRHDLIAVYHLGKLALSRVDVVAFLDMPMLREAA